VGKEVARRAASIVFALLAISALNWTGGFSWAEENQIERLAHRHFPAMKWTECERELLEHVGTGEIAYCGPSHSENDQIPADTGKKRMQFDVDADLIRWLCINGMVNKLVDPKGIWLHGARVIGQLDLSFATVPFPLAFGNSRFGTDISLADSQLADFGIIGGQIQIHGIIANRMTVRGDFKLINTNRRARDQPW
jgi:hypothetical protein